MDLKQTTMIQGFEEQTAPLTEYEESTLLPVVRLGLSGKIGKKMAASSKYICGCMRSSGYDITPERLRKIINHIRLHGLVECLVSSSKGYYIATSEQELLDYEESLKGRVQAIAAVQRAISAQRRRAYAEQEPNLFGV